MSFLSELKRRNVMRMGVRYVVIVILSGLDRMLDPLRGDPRFEDILAAVGFR